MRGQMLPSYSNCVRLVADRTSLARAGRPPLSFPVVFSLYLFLLSAPLSSLYDTAPTPSLLCNQRCFCFGPPTCNMHLHILLLCVLCFGIKLLNRRSLLMKWTSENGDNSFVRSAPNRYTIIIRKTKKKETSQLNMNSVISITSTPSSPIPSESWSRSAIPSPTPSQRTGDSHRGDTLHHFKATQQRTLSNSSLINTATTQECIDATVVGPIALSATKPTHVLAVDGKLIWRDEADSLLALHVGSSMDVDALQDGELLWVAGHAFRAMWIEQQLVLARL
ncbi:hypothetical protein BJ741DRAFT_52691 [Chytriomyces cf. hyalinus JEL632]|nr:hypothetical protein BJ741DRAFT_52691 [Chytriomyces cf. hyalinus JEL632]